MNVVFVGNRQCQFVGDVFRALISQRPELSVAYVNDDGDLPHQAAEAIRSADLLMLQERDAPRNLDLQDLNPDGRRIHFPDICVDFIWPFGGQPHVSNRPGFQLPAGPFPTALGDAYLNRRIETNFSPEILNEYLNLRVDHLIDLDAYREMVLDRQRRIDRASGTDWASKIQENLPMRPILRNPLHPTAWVLGDMMAQLLSRMDIGLSIADDKIAGACANTPEAPVHPCVAQHFELSWAPQGRLYSLRDGDRVSFPEYARRYIAYGEGEDLEIGVRAAAARSNDIALDSLRRAIERPLGMESVSAHSALARALAESGEGDAAFEALSVANAIEPGNPDILLARARASALSGRPEEAEKDLGEYLLKAAPDPSTYVAIADIHLASGRPREAAEALRLALAAPGADRGLQSRLTLALSASGDLQAASESAETEIRLDPDNPHPRTFLAGLLVRLGKRDAAKHHVEHALTTIRDLPDHGELRESLRSFYRKLDPPLREDLI